MKLWYWLKGRLGLCRHDFTMTADGIIASADLNVVMLGRKPIGAYGESLRYQIRCRCCKAIVARRNFERMEILGV